MESGYFDDFLEPLETVTWSGINNSGRADTSLIYRVSYEVSAFNALTSAEQMDFTDSYSFELDVADGVSISFLDGTTGSLLDGGSGGPDDVSPVPLPASLPILVAGLAGLLGLRRRQVG